MDPELPLISLYCPIAMAKTVISTAAAAIERFEVGILDGVVPTPSVSALVEPDGTHEQWERTN